MCLRIVILVLGAWKESVVVRNTKIQGNKIENTNNFRPNILI